MPRVMQVNSSSNLNLNTRGNPLLDSLLDETTLEEDSGDEDANRNYNQTQHENGDAQASMLRFPIDYDLYNVTYSAAEDERYCLKCNIDGHEVKFKKDARVWLHKSTDRKRKTAEAISSETGPSLGKNVRTNAMNSDKKRSVSISDNIIEIPKQIEARYSTVPNGYGNYRIVKDVDSDISSLGDEDADLTYSEETSPSMSVTCSVSFGINKEGENKPDEELGTTQEQIEVDQSTSDKSITDDKTIIDEKTMVDGIGEYLEKEHLDLVNASENNNGFRYGVTRRIAPAIVIEKESYDETLLDSAVNTFGHDNPTISPSSRIRGKSRGFRSTDKSSSRSSVNRLTVKRSRYNLRNAQQSRTSIISQARQMIKRKREQTASVQRNLRSPAVRAAIQSDIVIVTPGTSYKAISTLAILASKASNTTLNHQPPKEAPE